MVAFQRRGPAGKGSLHAGATTSSDDSHSDADGSSTASSPPPAREDGTAPLLASASSTAILQSGSSSSSSHPLPLQQQQQQQSAERRRRIVLYLCFWGGLGLVLTALLGTARSGSSAFLDRTNSRSIGGTTTSSSSSSSSQGELMIPQQQENDNDDDANHSLLRSTRNGESSNENDCTVWLAPSSLGEGSGYGIFTTRDLPAGASILGGPDGAGIPLVNTRQKNTPFAAERWVWRRVWKRYWWEKTVPGHVWFESTEALGRVADYQLGIGALPNHHCILKTISARYAAPPYDDSLVDRFRDAAAGAFTYNRGREFIVKEFRPAGSELFLNYGYCDRDASMPYWGDMVSVTEDFYTAASLVSKRGALKFDDTDGSLIVPQGTPLVVARLLPKTKSDREALLEDEPNGDDLVKRIALQSLDQRTPEWIRENGICLQNLLARPSTIAGAGQGAFAQRTIRKGEIVAPASLMQVVDKNALNLYDADGTRVGTQLLINYCFGHARSSMLLCPNTNAVLINHCSARTNDCGGGNGPNAIYQWSSGWDPSSDAWRQKTIEEIAEERGRGLAFEIVALRDIRPNEEVFIDYGVEWEQAWARHQASWKPPQFPPSLSSGSWISAKEANEMEGPILDDFVSGDLRQTVDHPYLFTGCQFFETDFDSRGRFRKNNVDWKNMTDREIVGRYATWVPSDSVNDDKRSYARHRDRSFWPCTVIRREKDNNNNTDSILYTVRIHQNDGMEELAWHRHSLPRFLINYPRAWIHYFVRPLASDQHLPGVFRHPIGIREELFPEHWKNLVTQD